MDFFYRIEMEPVTKRPRTEDAPPKAQICPWSSYEVLISPEFSIVLADLSSQFVRHRQALALAMRDNALSPLGFYLNKATILEDPAIATNSQLRVLVERVVDEQHTLINAFFEFMEEAAVIFEFTGPLRLNGNEVLMLARSLPTSIFRYQLVAYIKETMRYYLTLSDLPHTAEVGDALIKYVGLSARMRRDEGATAFIDAISEGFGDRNKQGAFFAVCTASGTGKTQLAFTLPDVWQVLYLNMSLEKQRNELQPVYRNFSQYMEFILEKLKEDHAAKNSELWIYGFVEALLALLKQNPGLNLPADLSRLRVEQGCDFVEGKTFRVVPVDLPRASNAIAAYQNSTGKKMLLFLDEFSTTKGLDQKTLALFRRNLIALNVCVVVASTECGASNMLDANAEIFISQSNASTTPWVYLCPQLPRYVSDPDLMLSVNSIEDEDLKTLLTLCLQSRPRFAYLAEGHIREFVSSGRDVVAFVEKLRSHLVQNVLRDKTATFSQEGCYGYVVAMLTAGFCLEGKSEKVIQLFADLSTKNWAYLVNEFALFTECPARTEVDEIKLDGSLDSEGTPKQARLAQDSTCEPTNMTEDVKKRTIAFRSLPNVEALFFTLWRRPGLSGMYFRTSSGDRYLSSSTYFPAPSDDFLLYLCLAGSNENPGLRVVKHADAGNVETRISASNLLKHVLNMYPVIKSPSANSPNWEMDEMIVCASFMTACNSGKLQGCSLEEFLSRFVSELIALDDHDYLELGNVDEIKWCGSFQAQFMWRYNTRLPSAVNKMLNTIQSTRPPNSQMFDAGTFVETGASGEVSLKCLVEVKSSINPDNLRTKIHDALARQDSKAKVSFIVVNASIKHLQDFNLSKYAVLNRAQRDEQKRTFVKGKLMTNARLFKVGVDENRKVQLTGMDGDTSETADRLIFLISRHDIAHQCTHALA